MGMKHAIGLNSGTDALWLAFLALGLGKGDEIITTSNTFFATAEAIWLIGATPVFVDCEADTRNIDSRRSKRRSPLRPRPSCRCIFMVSRRICPRLPRLRRSTICS